ncbi:hypothetical protein OG205_09790 [Lentzea sp. NBC_00516]|uniref:TetR family transcriptional regulator n=1 Tax=Lentzea sokolovensis TaxID=3095429 RepID=A0ABU4UPM7_9PSEU|nr:MULTISPECIES: hypothetical protein [unclassified Lentzea]MDX8141443.1 hypothetical protein [Lentzea sp. BCCO 10_0061]WUD27266.1 hypothetical protein OG205_09790 [Lentzea sp. NBC_00516]
MTTKGYTARHRAMLQAIADGRGELACGRAPSLSVDGLWCDFTATIELFTGGLFRPVREAAAGALAPAVLTTFGAQVLRSLLAV